ncbi:hypothetical protein TRFO_05183 [Tritrichomonas foetus]|uniref:Uncharacterized protein n=1 Tax=Tritrichomonas foetus TaxID=1144522 RepID=A0A1J4KDK9_9EUKA|nr:hypothetical protein TRFO_05183 [Tritrichomonas foetus]|eukprot:OHT07549.1 hypothetical protein TRFO_05183 [Tritrichomonas foetus]
MQVPDLCCSCHNVCIRGDRVSSNNRPTHRHSHSHLNFESYSPVFQIHTGSIRLSNTSMVTVSPTGAREIEVTCLGCQTKFLVYASRKGAFCQKEDALPNKRSRSFSTEGSLGSIYSDMVPSSLRQLFDRKDDSFELELPDEELDASIVLSSNLEQDEDSDYELMFSNVSDRFVGCYASVGKFVTDATYLNFAD